MVGVVEPTSPSSLSSSCVCFLLLTYGLLVFISRCLTLPSTLFVTHTTNTNTTTIKQELKC